MTPDILQSSLGNPFLAEISPQLFEQLRPYLCVREAFPSATKFDGKLVFPIDCQVVVRDFTTHEELAWAGKNEGVLVNHWFADVANTELVPRTKGHVYEMVLSAPGAGQLAAFWRANRREAFERALKWQLEKSRRTTPQNILAHLLSFDGWTVHTTHTLVAEALGTRRETIGLAVKQLVKHGYVEQRGRFGLHLLDRVAAHSFVIGTPTVAPRATTPQE
jgi:hypothetical protein